MQKKTLKIEGMTCAACVRAVERSVKKLDGVADANVNLATEKLSISFEPSKVKTSDIKKAVSKAGYKALDDEISIDYDREKKEKEMQLLWKKFIISLIFTIPLLLISMGHMFGYKLPYMIDPTVHPMNFALIINYSNGN